MLPTNMVVKTQSSGGYVNMCTLMSVLFVVVARVEESISN